VKANKLIIAMDPSGMSNVRGNIAEQLKSMKSFQDAKPIPVSIVTQRFPMRWWTEAFNGDVRRAWTTDNCVNFVEIPIHPHAEDTNVIRSVFADGYCAKYWKTMYDADPSLGLIKEELKRSVSELFNMSVPDATETHYHYWPNGWYFQHPGAEKDMYELEEWAKRPMPNEDIALANEAWSPYRAWIKGPITSAIQALNEQHGAHIQIPTSSPSGWPSVELDVSLLSFEQRDVAKKIVGMSLRDRR